MKIWSITLILLIVFKTYSQGNTEEFNTLNAYKSCILKGETQDIEDFISEDFRVGVYQSPMATKYFGDVIENITRPNTMFWDAVLEKQGKRYCKVHYVFSDHEEVSNVIFSKKGKLLYSDYLDKKAFNFDRYGTSKKVATIPFKYNQGAIILKVKLNGSERELNMLFDTGADGLALKSDLQKAMNVKVSSKRNVFVPGGEITVNYSKENSIELGDFKLENQNMVMFPRIREGIDGIVGGSNFFRNYITEVNFELSQIRLYTFGENNFFEDYEVTSFRYSQGVPTIPIVISSQGNTFESEFILDAGANYQAIMFGSGTKQQDEALLAQSMRPLFTTYNTSVGHKNPVEMGLVDSISFAGLTFKDASLAVEAYDAERHAAHEVLGSIGIQFLRRLNWVIDLNTYHFYTQKHTESMLPLDFVLGDYLLGYVNNVLVVKRHLKEVVVTSNTDDLTLKQWDRIMSIDGVSFKDLDSNKIKEFQKNKKVPIQIYRRGQMLNIEI
ncbi:retropepsin-like aspartic protease [Aestuariibaculum sediminum]|uniref:Aspartyl protease family protein n=1 Tax=Aestuariibaculum sediminum TaxID=2770637 RepID=A0A8J6Q955_9FLAO|nr:retropepsin-like aspartic protease [Aestuariibaculum sediminum]MBD0832182.1 aspartyl protease family protein [Aestuariibaculum sediminum]